ncbi:MAG TPA: hypothetical protein PLX56_11080 [bacterium]|nr:hypothetical protein [bacterium]
MKKGLFLLIVLGFFQIFAGDLFINGVKATGMKDTELKNCNVKIDSSGNIHIDAPGVKIVDESAKPSKEYIISISFDKPLTNDFVFFINGKEAVKILKGQQDSILEINPFLKKGENVVAYNSVPNPEVIKFTIVAGTGIKKGSSIEFAPFAEHKGEINNLGASGNFKIVAE